MKIIVLIILVVLFYTTNAEWEMCNKNRFGGVSNLAANNNLVLAATWGEYISKSTDNCDNWEMKTSGLTRTNFYSIVITNNEIYAGSDSGVFISTDYGENWSQNISSYNVGWTLALGINGNNIFAGTQNGILLSTDKGLNWTHKDSALPINTIVISFAFVDNNIYASSSDGIYLSNDCGDNWKKKISGYFPSLAVCGKDIFGCTSSGNVYISTNNGETWVRKINGLTVSSLSSLLTIGTHIFAGNENGVYHSSDHGESWLMESTVLLNSSIYTLANNDKYIFAGTTNGDVFRTKLSDFGITDVPYTKITNFEYQIIPNPASDFIEITGVGAQNVGAHCNVPLQDIQNNIQIYNILGEMVLFNPQPLTPEPLKINISALSAGVYYLKIGNVVKMFIKE